jgi:hypothetical protein
MKHVVCIFCGTATFSRSQWLAVRSDQDARLFIYIQPLLSLGFTWSGAVDADGLLPASRVVLCSIGSPGRSNMVTRAAALVDLDVDSVATPFTASPRTTISIAQETFARSGRGGKMCKRLIKVYYGAQLWPKRRKAPKSFVDALSPSDHPNASRSW